MHFQEVLAERAEVHITSNIEAATLIETYPEMAIIPVKKPKYPTPLAWFVEHGSPSRSSSHSAWGTNHHG